MRTQTTLGAVVTPDERSEGAACSIPQRRVAPLHPGRQETALSGAGRGDGVRDVPFEELEIDRGFVHDAASDPARVAIVQASCRVARDLGMKVVAEGVENREDWEFVVAHGCDVAQGWYVAKALPASGIAAWAVDGCRRRRARSPSGRA